MKNSKPIEPQSILPLPRKTTWQEWERGRAARRALAMRITGGKILRRASGHPRKDRLLRQLYDGERGLPFLPL
jgi:hypothetical protein